MLRIQTEHTDPNQSADIEENFFMDTVDNGLEDVPITDINL